MPPSSTHARRRRSLTRLTAVIVALSLIGVGIAGVAGTFADTGIEVDAPYDPVQP